MDGLAARAPSALHELFPRRLTRKGAVWLQHIREGRFQQALALVTAGAAVLGGLEVSYEHYRGSYGTQVMYTPVLLTPPLVAAGLWTVWSPRAARWALPLASAAVLVDGLVGLGFHVRGVARKPGGWRLPVFNIIMGPPLLAPVLFAIPGYLGLVASFLRRGDDPWGRFLPRVLEARARRSFRRGFLPRWGGRGAPSLRHEVREGKFQKHMAGAAAASAIFSSFEALYSHYKNNFRFKVQWTPVVVGPLLALASIGAIFRPALARVALPVTSALAVANGGVGFAYHARGVLRRPGGVRHLAYNVMYGPPIFAPLLFAASGFLGLLASLMRRER